MSWFFKERDDLKLGPKNMDYTIESLTKSEKEMFIFGIVAAALFSFFWEAR